MHTALLERGDAIGEQILSVEDLGQVAAQLELEAVAAKTGSHVEARCLWCRRDRGVPVRARRIEAIAQYRDRGRHAEPLRAELLAGCHPCPLRFQVEERG